MRISAKLLLLLLFPLLALSCGKASESKSSASFGSGELRWASFPIVLHADTLVNNDPNATQDLQDAINYWQNLAGKNLFSFQGEWTTQIFTGPAHDPSALFANVIFFQNPWPFDAGIAGKTTIFAENNSIYNAGIFLNPNTPLCTGDCFGQTSQTSRRKLLAHELGHMLGLGHSDDPNNIMHTQITFGGSLHGLTADTELLTRLTN